MIFKDRTNISRFERLCYEVPSKNEIDSGSINQKTLYLVFSPVKKQVVAVFRNGWVYI